MLRTSPEISLCIYCVYDDYAFLEVLFCVSGVGPIYCMNNCRVRLIYVCKYISRGWTLFDSNLVRYDVVCVCLIVANVNALNCVECG